MRRKTEERLLSFALRSHWDQWLLLLLLGAFNLHLFGLPVPVQHYLPESVADGEWWRVVTHAFAHVSWYHLLLDAGGFWLLYATLRETRCTNRLLVTGACILGSLLSSVIFAPDIGRLGLCGLSGAAHGLLAFAALELINHREEQGLGWILLLAVLAKGVVEAVSGQVLFAALHLGDVGSPVAVCHLGGVIGGIGAALVLQKGCLPGGTLSAAHRT